MLIEKITNVAFANGLLRVECASFSANGEEKSVGELVIPAASIQHVMNTMVKSIQEIERQQKEAAANQG
ncbi:MAG: hypothetical protein ACOCWR_08490 [Oceanidesulfovibrio sp.]